MGCLAEGGSGANLVVGIGVGLNVGLGLGFGVRSGDGLVQVGLAEGSRAPGIGTPTGAADGALVGVQVIILALLEESGFRLAAKITPSSSSVSSCSSSSSGHVHVHPLGSSS